MSNSFFERAFLVPLLIFTLVLEIVLPIPFSQPEEVHAAVDATENEYQIEVGPITGTASANYVYASFFNPGSSGKTVSIKSISVRAEATTTANYVNLSTRRTSSASAGTQIAAADIPKKNTSSANPVMEVRHTGVTVGLSGATESRLLGQAMPGANGQFYSRREITFSTSSEKLILQQGEGIAVYQEAAGDTDQLIRVTIEWEELASVPTAQNEFMMALPRVENAAAADYTYNAFFNPTNTGKAALVKRIWFGSETCDGAAVYTNNIVLRRISNSTGGTFVATSSIPKKNTNSSSSVMDIRHTNVTETLVGGADARLGHVTPCGAAGETQGWQEHNFHPSDAPIVLKPGEGIALIADATGNANQIVRMFIEWQEVAMASVPSEDGEYLWASSRVENVALALGTTTYTIYNPVSSSKTVLVRRMGIRNDADGAAAYSTFNFQRISTSTTGTLITASNLPKKHASSSDAVLEVRWCGATCTTNMNPTYLGSRSISSSGLSDSGLFKSSGAGAVGQIIGLREISFGDNEPIVLKPGEGIGVYINYLAGNANHYTKVFFEWEEESSTPSTQNQYLVDIGSMPGNTGTSYNYATFFNPASATVTAVVKRISLRVDTITTAVYIPMRIRPLVSASGGTQIAVADIPKKHSSSSNSQMEIRRTGVTATYATTSILGQAIGVTSPGAAGSAILSANTGYYEMLFANDEPLILQPGEGIGFHHDTSAGDADFRSKLLIEWEEIATSSAPAADNHHLLTMGSVNGSASANYVYATLFNPAGSEHTYAIQRISIRAARTGALTAPGNIPISVRRISSASNGTLLATSTITKKHSDSASTTAEARSTGVTVTFSQATSSRIYGARSPGAANNFGNNDKEIYFGDELILLPGEGIALYQETAAGDTNLRYWFTIGWEEVVGPKNPPTLTFSISDSSVGFGTLIAGGSRYATGNTLGASSDTGDAHTLSITTNADDGFVLSATGTTLTCTACSGATVTAIGGTATTALVGTEQFGLRATTTSGNGTVASPYASSLWAFDTAAFPDVLATGPGDEVETILGVRYMSNIASNSDPGSYSAVITYIVTSSF